MEKEDSPKETVGTLVDQANMNNNEFFLSLAKFPDENPNPVLRVTKDGRLIYANSGSSSLLNHWKCKVGQFLPDNWRKFIRGVFSAGLIRQAEERYGNTILSLIFTPISNSDYVNIYGMDDTDRVQALMAHKIRSHELLERVKELDCLYNILKVQVDKQDSTLEQILQKIIEFIPPSWQFPDVTCGRIVLNGLTFTTDNFRETDWKQTSDIFVYGKRVGVLEVFYLQEKPEMDEGPFRNEERNLINAVTEMIGKIIEQDQTGKALQESERRFRTLFEQAAVGVAQIISETGQFFKVNQRYCDIVGYSLEEIEKLTFQEITHPDDLQIDLHNKELLLRGEIKEFTREKRYIHKDGSTLWVNMTVSRMWRAGEKPEYYIAVVEDINKRKHVEEELRIYREELEDIVAARTSELEKSRLWMTSIYESLEEAVLVVSPDRILKNVNRATEKMFGYSRQELVGQSTEILHVDHEHYLEFAKRIKEAFDKGEPAAFEFEAKRKNNEIFPTEHTISLLKDGSGKLIGILSVLKDISERKKTENMFQNIAEKVSVKTGEAYFDSLTEFIAKELNTEYVLVGEFDAENNKVRTISVFAHGKIVDNMEYDLTNTPCDKVIGREACVYTENIQELFPEDKMLVDMKLESYMGIPLFGSDGQPLGIVAALGCSPINKGYLEKSISKLKIFSARASSELERMKVEEALQMERDKLKTYLDTSAVIVVIVDADQNVSLINKRGCEILGYDEDEIIGKNWFDKFLPESDMVRVKEEFNNLVAGNIKFVEYFENEILTKNGEKRPIAWYNTILRNEKGEMTATLSSGGDITERKKLEEQLLHSQKMESIGTLAGGVAHDFNNILTAIIGFANVLESDMPEDDPSRFYVEQIQAAADTAANLTSSLLTFSRKHKINPMLVELNSIVKKMEKLLFRIIGEDIEFRTEITDERLYALVDFSQMQQVIMNLAINARDAMPEGGILTVSTESAVIDNEFIKSHGYGKTGEYAIILVSDTGSGFDENTKGKIFEPFFTSKEVNKGTGLGLSIVYGIVKQHNGYIDVKSAPGKGTTFRIYLPHIKRAEDVEEVLFESPGLVSGTETILFAEDDAAIRQLLTSVLSGKGYGVIVAEDGVDALNKFRENRESIDFVLLDVIMPGKKGTDLFKEIKAERPDMKALFISGYSEELMHDKHVLEKGLNIIPKPFKPDDLLRKIREILDQVK